MTSIEERERRVAAGSRRKRDLEAAGRAPAHSFSDNRWVKWCRENLPDEHTGYAYIATQHLILRLPKDERKPPTVEAVLAELRRMGNDRESLG